MPQRHREEIILPFTTEDRYKTNNSGGPFFEAADFVASEDRSFDDVVTKDYSKRIAKGDVINNPCAYVHTTHLHTGGSYLRGDNDTTTAFVQHDGGNLTHVLLQADPGSPRPSPSLSDGEKLSKLHALANMDKTPYAFGEDLLEVGETIRFLKSPFKSLASLAKEIRDKAKRVSKRKNYSLEKAIADVYAQYNWALLPLLRSAQDLAELLATTPRTRPQRLNARGFETTSEHDSSAPRSSGFPSSTYWGFDSSMQIDEEHHAHILYWIDNPMQTVRFRLGLRNKDIPHTLWQILPLSFMMDRVIDISSSIQALSNIYDPSLHILAASHRVKSTIVRNDTLDTYSSPGWTWSANGGTHTQINFAYTRKIWQPSSVDALPVLEKDRILKDVQSIADLTALIVQRLT